MKLTARRVVDESYLGRDASRRYPELFRLALDDNGDVYRDYRRLWELHAFDPRRHLIVIVNTARDERNEQTSWRWFQVARPGGLAHRLRIRVEFLDDGARPIAEDSIGSVRDRAFDDEGDGLSTSFPVHPMNRINFNDYEEHRYDSQRAIAEEDGEQEALALVGPYFFVMNVSYGYFVESFLNTYATSLAITREFKRAPEDLARLGKIRCSIVGE